MSSSVVRFYVVGLIGVGVQLSALAALTQVLGVDYRISTAIAVEIAVIHNFLWHESWTWPARGVDKRLLRLLQFNLSTGAFSILANVVLTSMFVDVWHITYLVANALAVAMASVANYLAADRVVWAQRRT